MRYALAMLSHGKSETSRPCLESFLRHVTPKPSVAIALHDGDGEAYRPIEIVTERVHDGWLAHGWKVAINTQPEGFCRATGSLWRLAVARAAEEECDRVFWLEHDFVFTRPLDLRPLSHVLGANPQLAQMALMRGPVNKQEVAAGGLVESRGGVDGGTYVSKVSTWGIGTPGSPREMYDWLEHSAYFTTNPSLMRIGFMRDLPWPLQYERECEGRYGLDLVEKGFTFGVWGEGDPWVDHIGHRDGKGFGY